VAIVAQALEHARFIGDVDIERIDQHDSAAPAGIVAAFVDGETAQRLGGEAEPAQHGRLQFVRRMFQRQLYFSKSQHLENHRSWTRARLRSAEARTAVFFAAAFVTADFFTTTFFATTFFAAAFFAAAFFAVAFFAAGFFFFAAFLTAAFFTAGLASPSTAFFATFLAAAFLAGLSCQSGRAAVAPEPPAG